VGHQVSIKGSLLQPAQSLIFVIHCLHDQAWRTLVLHAQALATLVPGGIPRPDQTKNVWLVFDPNGPITLGGTSGAPLNRYLEAWSDHFPVLEATGISL
jgi:hypothetical protein